MRLHRSIFYLHQRVQQGIVDQAIKLFSCPRSIETGGSGAVPESRQLAGRPWTTQRLQHTDADSQQATSATMLSGMAVQLTQGDPFLSSITASEGPIKAYKVGREQLLYRKDPRQELTMLRIQRVYEELKQLYPDPHKRSGLTMGEAMPVQENTSWFSSWFGAGGSRHESSDARQGPLVKGLYMYGGLGVGKTMIMDLLAQCAPPQFKLLRTHYHDFMLDVHGKLRTFQKTADPLSLVADQISESMNVLCLDEFFVTDVADAMILHRLFGRLWDRHLVLVATSNRAPDALYEGGLQRNLFLPFIHRLKEECEVHDMNSQTDYRRLARHHKGLYFVTPTREEDLYQRFIDLAAGEPIRSRHVDVAMGRQLHVPRAAGSAALFDFKELCDRPLAAADYIALARSFDTVALSGVPVFTAANRTSAYRFVTLVDVFYEHRTRVLLSAEALPFELFENIKTNQEAKAEGLGGGCGGGKNDALVVDDNLGFAKDRTVSRLTEMQSREYLVAFAKHHAPHLVHQMEVELAHEQGR